MAHELHDQHATPDADRLILDDGLWTTVRNSLAFLALGGWAAIFIGGHQDHHQAHFSYHVAFLFCVSIILGALFYVMLQHLTGSAWSVTVRRLMENVMRVAPLTFVLAVPTLLGTGVLYEWARPGAAHDPTLAGKLGYLSNTWFLIRSLIVIALWSLFALKLYGASRRQDESGSLDETRRAKAWSASGIVMLFVTASVAGFDWVMSLNPRWYSTMFGVYFLSGGAVGFMAALIAITLGLRSAGYLRQSVTEEHYHDLGKWLFALTVFWAYISFSQYMLIWYGNLPEEGIWFVRRLTGSWSSFLPLLIYGHFFVPFFFMLPRAAKRNLRLLGFFSAWMLVMHYADLYWQVMPVLHKGGVAPSWMDLAALVAVASTFGLVFWAGLRRRPLVPVGDPRLNQCLGFHNA